MWRKRGGLRGVGDVSQTVCLGWHPGTCGAELKQNEGKTIRAMKKRILILDDDDAFREDLGELLSMDGHEVEGIGAAASLSAAGLAHCDLLLLDLSGPGLDGTQVLRELSEHPTGPDVVLISGRAEDIIAAVADAGRLRGVSILGAFKKPFAAEDLLSLIDADPVLKPVSARGASGIDEAGIIEALAGALNRGDLSMMFQPKVDARSLAFHGAEVLLADHLPGVGRIAVPRVIAAAGRAPDVLKRLTHETLKAGARACNCWHALGCRGAVSINLPMDVLLGAGTAKDFAHLVAAEGLTPSDVTCELTEDALYDSSSECLLALAQMRIAGFGIALDDVGKRQSGLLQLARLPVTELKIDMDLLHRARSSAKAGQIFASLVELGHRLGMVVVAEGVETRKDLHFVRVHGVDLVQGYLIARKMPINELIGWLEAGQSKSNAQHELVRGDVHGCADAQNALGVAGGG